MTGNGKSRSAGVTTRSRTRQREAQPPTNLRNAGAGQLTSPTAQLDEYFRPRKSLRLAGKYAKDVIRQARAHGAVSYVPPLTGYLGSIPQEVR